MMIMIIMLITIEIVTTMIMKIIIIMIITSFLQGETISYQVKWTLSYYSERK